ncbi:MAG: hypothetical protein ACR2OZ_16130 [Verrucomicrobiales bacterium]
MRTTIDVPDDLFRKVKAKAALEGQSLKDLVTEGLRLVLQMKSAPPRRRVDFPLIRGQGKTLKITAEMIATAQEQEDIQRYARTLRR